MVAAGGDEVDMSDDLLGNELGVNGDDDRIWPVSGDLAEGILAVSPIETIRGDDAFVIAASIVCVGEGTERKSQQTYQGIGAEVWCGW